MYLQINKKTIFPRKVERRDIGEFSWLTLFQGKKKPHDIFFELHAFP